MSKFGIFEKLHKQIDTIGQSLETLLESVTQRVENEVGSHFMSKVVPLLLASSHFGLTELRLLKLTEDDSDNGLEDGLKMASAPSTHTMKMFVFLNGLEIFLVQHSLNELGVVQLKPGIYLEFLKSKYASRPQCISEAHRTLARLYQTEYHQNTRSFFESSNQ